MILMTSLKDFMISRVRVKLLELFFSNQDQLYYVREITRHTKEEINAVRRELDKMLGYGLLNSEPRGNRTYYFLNKRYLYYQELQQMVFKSTGLAKKLLKARSKLGDVKYVMFSGEFVRGAQVKHGQVDVLVIGDIVLPELQTIIKDEETVLGREINYTVFSLEEFEFRKTRRDPFIMDILYSTRIMVIGNEDEFVNRQIPGLS
jgi:hypothetical protein